MATLCKSTSGTPSRYSPSIFKPKLVSLRLNSIISNTIDPPILSPFENTGNTKEEAPKVCRRPGSLHACKTKKAVLTRTAPNPNLVQLHHHIRFPATRTFCSQLYSYSTRSIRTAQILNSGIRLVGSSASLVNWLIARSSPQWKGTKTVRGWMPSVTFT